MLTALPLVGAQIQSERERERAHCGLYLWQALITHSNYEFKGMKQGSGLTVTVNVCMYVCVCVGAEHSIECGLYNE